MTRYHVDADAVLSTNSAVQAAIGRIQSEVATMHTLLVDLQSSWGGQAASAFQGVVADWRATQLRVEESITAINQALAFAGQQYAEIEHSNSRMFLG